MTDNENEDIINTVFENKMQKRKRIRKEQRKKVKRNRAVFAAHGKVSSVLNMDHNKGGKQTKCIVENGGIKQTKICPRNTSISSKIGKRSCKHLEEPYLDGHCDGGFKMSSSVSSRMALLQEYVNKETNVGDSSFPSKKSNNKMHPPPDHAEPIINLIKDKKKLKNLRKGQEDDTAAISMYAKLLGLEKKKKKRLAPDFEVDFGILLDDIEEGNLIHIDNYKEEYSAMNEEDELERDIQVALSKRDKNVITKPTMQPKNKLLTKSIRVKRNNLCKSNQHDEDSINSESEKFPDQDSILQECEDSEESFDTDKESRDERRRETNDFLDDEAEESEMESDDNSEVLEDDFRREINLAFEGGASGTSRTAMTEYQDADLYSSDSQDDEDLEGFIVDDDFVEYESESEPDKEPVQKRRRIIVCTSESESDQPISPMKGRCNEVIQKEEVNNDIYGGVPIMEKEMTVDSEISCELSMRKNYHGKLKTKVKKKKGKKIIEKSEDISLDNQTADSLVMEVKNRRSHCDQIKKRKNRSLKVEDHDNEDEVNIVQTLEVTTENHEGDVTTKSVKKRKRVKEAKGLSIQMARPLTNEEYKEDIYGRFRDRQGNVVKLKEECVEEGQRYLPPALRKLAALNSTSSHKSEQLLHLRRLMKGLLNRLAESNMANILSQVEEFFCTYGRNDTSECLTALCMESLVEGSDLAPERMLQEHAMLVAALSANVGNEVGAHVLNEVVLKWNDTFEALCNSTNDYLSLELDNALLFIAQLYNFRVVDSILVYDILQTLVSRFGDKEIALILTILCNIGFTLRKDDPMELKALIGRVQTQAACHKESHVAESYSKVKFTLEMLQVIKNNNMAKVPNYDPTHVEYLKKALKGMVRKGCLAIPLKVRLDDLLKARWRGRWWIVGSAWHSDAMLPEKLTQTQASVEMCNGEENFNEKFLRQARKLHLARPPRINILYAVTEGAEDYLDAAQKVLQLGLQSGQEVEVCHVLLLCGRKGRVYNPFFAHVAAYLCMTDHKYRRLLHTAVWDCLPEIPNWKEREAGNLASFLAHVIGANAVPLSMLKTISFSEIDTATLSFLRQMLILLLLHPAGSEAVSNTFAHLNTSPKLRVLRQSLRLFMLKFVKPGKGTDDPQKQLLRARVKMAATILSSLSGVSL